MRYPKPSHFLPPSEKTRHKGLLKTENPKLKTFRLLYRLTVFNLCMLMCDIGLSEQTQLLQYAPAAGKQGVWQREEGLPAEKERRV